jgi:hypothetical protein
MQVAQGLFPHHPLVFNYMNIQVSSLSLLSLRQVQQHQQQRQQQHEEGTQVFVQEAAQEAECRSSSGRTRSMLFGKLALSGVYVFPHFP